VLAEATAATGAGVVGTAGTHATSVTAFPEMGGPTGASPQSKTIPMGHNPSQGLGVTRRDGTPRPERDYGVWRAKEMVDRGRIELPTPGFSVLRPGGVYGPPLDVIAMNPGTYAPSLPGFVTVADRWRSIVRAKSGQSRPTSGGYLTLGNVETAAKWAAK
jgi:hypothetical protein